MKRDYYSDSIAGFLVSSATEILGQLFASCTDGASIEATQRDAWQEQINILQRELRPFCDHGSVFFEYTIPRVGKRVDVVVVIRSVVYVLEFKVGEREFTSSARDQVWDCALDLKNFHEATHDAFVAPILIATRADPAPLRISPLANDKTFEPIYVNAHSLGQAISAVLSNCDGQCIDPEEWRAGRYRPTPTIIEAAIALYSGHSVEEIARRDATETNLHDTSDIVSEIIQHSREAKRKSICFVTGVPGAGKTLVGLNIATKYFDKDADLYSVFLSGNGPLVAILREALTRDKVRMEKAGGRRVSKTSVMSEVKMFIQNIHHFRDDCLTNREVPPVEHVALFDEAQRAWNLEQTSSFMLRKKELANFCQSEPEFLISCLDRHKDWAVIVCLVGGGQEINTGEAGIGEWIDSLIRSFPDWDIYLSSRMTDSEYAAGEVLNKLASRANVTAKDDLHLGVSMRSFRAEEVSALVKHVLDLDKGRAASLVQTVIPRYPIVLTRDIDRAKRWLQESAHGSQRFGIVASSSAQRLKPLAIDVKSPTDPVHWFLDGKTDVRSSYYLEEVATEFQVQGLELDWACVAWDADLRYTPDGWDHWSFCGTRWNRIRNREKQSYLKNAYRVLLTRARQGMVLFIPEGDQVDPTRDPAFYDANFNYLVDLGFEVL